MMRAEEVIIPLPSPRSLAPRTTMVRGSWLLSSQRTMREGGLLDRYLAFLADEHRAVIERAAPSEWYPIDVCVAHYNAADRLEVPTNEIIAMGVKATRYAHATVIGVAAKLAGGAGATPWTIFGQAQRLWERSFVGGAVGVTKLGPKELRLELVGWPCAGIRYTRLGMRGVLTGAAELVCQKAYATEIEDLCTPMTLGYRLSWA